MASEIIESRTWDVTGKGAMELSIERYETGANLMGGEYVVWVRMHHATPQGRNTAAQHMGFADLTAARLAYAAQVDKMDALPIAVAR